MTTDVEKAAASNNPAGRVYAFLRDFESFKDRAPQESAMKGLMGLLGAKQESPEIFAVVASLRQQARLAEDLMERYAGVPGYSSYREHYSQVYDATMRLQVAHQYQAEQIFTSFDVGGWTALRFADETLSYHQAEASLSTAQVSEYLKDVRSLIEEIAADDSLEQGDRDRITDLLHNVERALRDVKVGGVGPVEDSAAAAGVGISRPDLWDRVAGHKWTKRVGGVVLSILVAVGYLGGPQGIESMFGDNSDRPLTVIVQHQQMIEGGSGGEEDIVDGEIVEDDDGGSEGQAGR